MEPSVCAVVLWLAIDVRLRVSYGRRLRLRAEEARQEALECTIGSQRGRVILRDEQAPTRPCPVIGAGAEGADEGC